MNRNSEVDRKQTIVVQIAAYCDPELENTVRSAIQQADDPDRVRFVICLQDDKMLDYIQLRFMNNVDLIHLWVRDSTGPCKARYICQQHVRDTDEFVFHIDSHMRFVKHWDTKIVKQWYDLNDEKAIISAYPINCSHGDMMTCSFTSHVFDDPTPGVFMRFLHFHKDALTWMCQGYSVRRNSKHVFKRNPFIGAGYFFGPVQVDRDVLVDPNMYYYGDESIVSIRLFTHGYNVYTVDELYAYHQYIRPDRKYSRPSDAADRSQYEASRLRIMAGLETDCDGYLYSKFGIGRSRTVHEYEVFSGIDIATHNTHNGSPFCCKPDI